MDRINKKLFFDAVSQALNNFNSQLIEEYKTYFGGGTMLSWVNGCYRTSNDLDFLCNLTEYQKLRKWFNNHRPLEIFVDNFKIAIARDIKQDEYGIRIPLSIVVDNLAVAIELEFIVENRFELEEPIVDKATSLPLLSYGDRFGCKLLANADRWNDASVFARDLIDLAVLRLSQTIPQSAIEKAEAVYKVEQPLVEAIVRFSNAPKLRQECYRVLQIDNPVMVIDGIDKLAADYHLSLVEREFIETDFSYLG